MDDRAAWWETASFYTDANLVPVVPVVRCNARPAQSEPLRPTPRHRRGLEAGNRVASIAHTGEASSHTRLYADITRAATKHPIDCSSFTLTAPETASCRATCSPWRASSSRTIATRDSMSTWPPRRRASCQVSATLAVDRPALRTHALSSRRPCFTNLRYHRPPGRFRTAASQALCPSASVRISA